MMENSGIEGLVGRTFKGYRVTRFLARGGMGVVYEAIQESLDRPVAIKFLYPHLSGDRTFRDRFEREARSIARFNHPNIVRVLDFGSEGSLHYMVMDLIEGDSLRDRLTRLHSEGVMLKTDAVVNIIQQVGSALSYAHRQGYVHRDVKPGNILLTQDGRALLTDFGVVKILGNVQITAAGAMIGTPEYMSPEQSLGEGEVTPASDVYSLAIVAYEMLVGRVPFHAPTPVAVIRMQLNEPPPRPSTFITWFPQPVEDVLMQALAKNPADRYESVDAFLGSLLMVLPPSQGSGATGVAVNRGSQPSYYPGQQVSGVPATGSMPGTGAGTGQPVYAAESNPVAAGTPPPASAPVSPAPAPVARAAAPPPAPPPSDYSPTMAASGSRPTRTYAMAGGGLLVILLAMATGLYVLLGNGGDGSNGGGGSGTSTAVVSGGAGTGNPSPTATSVASTGTEPTAEATATAETIATPAGSAATVPPDKIPVIVFSSNRGGVHDSQIFLMNLDGSGQRQLTFARGHSWGPRVSPDGTKMLFSSVIGAHTTHDPSAGALSGSAGGTTSNHDIFVADLKGSDPGSVAAENIVDVTTELISWENGWSWSPDSKWIAFSSNRDGKYDIYKMTVDGKSITKLTNGQGSNGWPVWTPDGKQIVFSSDRSGNEEIWIMNQDGSGVKQLSDRPSTFDVFPAVSPDGKQVIFSSQTPGLDLGDIWIMDIDGRNSKRLTNTAALNNIPSFCPAGDKIVFMSDQGGNPNFNVYIMNADGSDPKRLTSTGTNEGQWAGDQTPNCTYVQKK